MKKVSVIIPAYNKSDLTVRTVTSVLNQTYKNIEIIVVDDGSTDDTKNKLKQFNKIIRYIYKENSGACSARNFGINVSTGEYIGLIDCDDIYYPDKISLCVEFFENNPDVSFIHTAANYIDSKDRILGLCKSSLPKELGLFWDNLVLGNVVCNPTVFIKRCCFESVGLFDESIFMPADWDMWIRIAEKFKIGYIDKPLSGYRTVDNYIIGHLERNFYEEEYVIKKVFDRNKQEISKKTINKCYAALFYRFGILYSLKDDVTKSREYFYKSIHNYFNIKYIGRYLISILMPKLLRINIKKRLCISNEV